MTWFWTTTKEWEEEEEEEEEGRLLARAAAAAELVVAQPNGDAVAATTIWLYLFIYVLWKCVYGERCSNNIEV